MSEPIHVVPRADLVEHELSDGCICGPAVEFEEGGWIVVHHSLDGRERDELPVTGGLC